MSRQSEDERLWRERTAALEAATEARERLASATGQITAVQAINNQLTARLTTQAAHAERDKAGARRAVEHALLMRRVLAEHVLDLQAGADPAAAAEALLVRLAVGGIALGEDLARAAAARAAGAARETAAVAAARAAQTLRDAAAPEAPR